MGLIIQQETKLAHLERKVDHSRVLSKEFSSTALHNNFNGDMHSAPPRAADGSQQEVLHRCTKLLASALNFPNLDFQLAHVINNPPNGNPTLHNSLHGNPSRSSPRVSALSFPAVNGIHNPEQEQDQTSRHRQLKLEGERQRQLQYLEKEVRSCFCIRPMNCKRNYLLQLFCVFVVYSVNTGGKIKYRSNLCARMSECRCFRVCRKRDRPWSLRRGQKTRSSKMN